MVLIRNKQASKKKEQAASSEDNQRKVIELLRSGQSFISGQTEEKWRWLSNLFYLFVSPQFGLPVRTVSRMFHKYCSCC